MTGPFITVVVMTYNEAATLDEVVREIHGVLANLADPFEILIVDDGSTDGSGAAADRLAQSVPGVRVHHHPQNLGLGGVYRTGFAQASGTFLTFFPADGQFPAAIIAQFRPFVESHDLILGYVEQRRNSLLGSLLSRVERLIYRVLFGPMPRFQGIMVLRRRILQEIPLRATGRSWVVVMELILRASRQGYRIQSLPTVMRPRRAGHSKVNSLRSILGHLPQLWNLYRLM